MYAVVYRLNGGRTEKNAELFKKWKTISDWNVTRLLISPVIVDYMCMRVWLCVHLYAVCIM